MTDDRPEVLYVCVHNAGRSQMAALFTEQLGGDGVVVRSAGSEPADRVNPMVVEVMAELGLDMSQRFPAPLTDDAVRASDVVVSMGCGDECPYVPGKRYVDWDLEDPKGRPLDEVRATRDDIARRVEALVRELDGGSA